jgi:hypothetical protein
VNRRTIAVLACMLAAGACERAKAPAKGTPGAEPKPSPSTPSGVSSSIAAPARVWDDEIGGVLATPSLDGGLPVMFAHDTANTADIEVELLSHDALKIRGTLKPGNRIRACAWRRNATVADADGRPPSSGWSLALAPGMATPYSVDGIVDLLPRDSAATVARVSRLVSAIPEDSLSAPFRGLPIVVRDAWRFRLPDSTAVIVAIALRSLNVESNPRTEAITIIAEQDSSSSPGQWRTAFFERVTGPEDRMEGMDLLAAFQIRDSRPAVALMRDGDAGLQVEIVERTAARAWSIHWSSAALPCAVP